MPFRFKRLIAFFTLMIFLFPVVTEASHNYFHKSDFHCIEKSENHFHAQEHHCIICDFVTFTSDDTVHNIFIPATVKSQTTIFCFYHGIVPKSSAYNFSLRGPPTVI